MSWGLVVQWGYSAGVLGLGCAVGLLNWCLGAWLCSGANQLVSWGLDVQWGYSTGALGLGCAVGLFNWRLGAWLCSGAVQLVLLIAVLFAVTSVRSGHSDFSTTCMCVQFRSWL